MMIFKVLILISLTNTCFCNGNETLDSTDVWLKRNNYIFGNLFYTEKEIMDMKDKVNNMALDQFAVAKITNAKTFWTKISTGVTCPNEGMRQRRFDNLRHSRSTCSFCCSTEFGPLAPITVEFQGKNFNVYHPYDGWQILYVGNCPQSSTCSYGKCETDEDFQTYILVHDRNVNYNPAIKFIPVAYPRYCKCVNSY